MEYLEVSLAIGNDLNIYKSLGHEVEPTPNDTRPSEGAQTMAHGSSARATDDSKVQSSDEPSDHKKPDEELQALPSLSDEDILDVPPGETANAWDQTVRDAFEHSGRDTWTRAFRKIETNAIEDWREMRHFSSYNAETMGSELNEDDVEEVGEGIWDPNQDSTDADTESEGDESEDDDSVDDEDLSQEDNRLTAAELGPEDNIEMNSNEENHGGQADEGEHGDGGSKEGTGENGGDA